MTCYHFVFKQLNVQFFCKNTFVCLRLVIISSDMFGIPCVSIGFGLAARRMGTCLSRTFLKLKHGGITLVAVLAVLSGDNGKG